jgi:hypothetical protein
MCISGCSNPSQPSGGSSSGRPIGNTTGRCQPCPPCARYETVDRSRDVETFNCAGLAHRTYTYIGDLDRAKAMLSTGTRISCGSKCQSCQVKHWFWEYDLVLEDHLGNVLTPPNHDFHTVAGRCSECGDDPTNVYSKNGARPIEGPGTGPSFRPAVRDQARSNDRNARPATDSRGNPIYKHRFNIVETCHCLPCS